MLDATIIFTKGGVVLWTYSFLGNTQTLFRDALDRLIKTIFLEGKTCGATHAEATIEGSRFRWVTMNNIQSVVLAVYSGGTEAGYVDQVLQGVQREFAEIVERTLHGSSAVVTGAKIEETTIQTLLWRRLQEPTVATRFTQRFLSLIESCDALWERNIHSCLGKDARNPKSERPADQSRGTERKPKKVPTTWGTQKVTKRAMSALDFSATKENEKDADSSGSQYSDKVKLYNSESSVSDLCSESDDDDDDDNEDATQTMIDGKDVESSNFFSRVKESVQRSLTGNKVLTQRDVEGLITEMKTLLLEKNVAAIMVDQLMASVQTSLIGTRTNSFQSVKMAVRTALRTAMQRVLSQHNSTDVLKAAYAAKDQSRVYSICFLGVNGVGKSTSLAKVAYYLKHKGKLRVMFAACDTFRAGAVEQLKAHARNLGVHVYEQGYGKDAALICKNALKYAQNQGYDVVLIDTAGRMQDNEPLMRALAKLVALNNPDLVLFVGEALVGNDATDQLVKFHRSLVDFAPTTVDRPRGVDGIFLTKFDTVDAKVGAALSMTYASGCPIVFVGIGQKYTHIQTLKVNTVVNALLDN